jgi:hypothetical protein
MVNLGSTFVAKILIDLLRHALLQEVIIVNDCL